MRIKTSQLYLPTWKYLKYLEIHTVNLLGKTTNLPKQFRIKYPASKPILKNGTESFCRQKMQILFEILFELGGSINFIFP